MKGEVDWIGRGDGGCLAKGRGESGTHWVLRAEILSFGLSNF